MLIATLGGIGRIGFAPGTFGSVAGLLLAVATAAAAGWLAERVFPGIAGAAPACEAGIVAAICLAGVPICSRAATALGRGKDPGAIVFDEMAALPMALLAVPPAARSAAVLGTAFVLFRFFDVTKPFPARQLERLPEGWGIMADDWAAAGWAAAVLAAVRAAGWV